MTPETVETIRARLHARERELASAEKTIAELREQNYALREKLARAEVAASYRGEVRS